MTQPCTPCARLAGSSSATPPHPRLALERAGAVLDRDIAAGSVERYRCADCDSLMLRFLRGPVAPGASGIGTAAWRLVPPTPRGPLVSGGGTG